VMKSTLSAASPIWTPENGSRSSAVPAAGAASVRRTPDRPIAGALAGPRDHDQPGITPSGGMADRASRGDVLVRSPVSLGEGTVPSKSSGRAVVRWAGGGVGVTAGGCREPAETRFKARAKCWDRGWLSHQKPDFSRAPPAARGRRVKISRVPPRACSVPDEISRAPQRSALAPGESTRALQRSASVPGESSRAPARPASSPAAETVPEMRTAPRRWGGNRVSSGRGGGIPRDVRPGSGKAAYRPSATSLPSGPHAYHGPA
jgi:hypothetical protein